MKISPVHFRRSLIQSSNGIYVTVGVVQIQNMIITENGWGLDECSTSIVRPTCAPITMGPGPHASTAESMS